MPIQKFEVVLNTSNENTKEVRQKLQEKLSDWLDNVSFLTGKKEVCKSVKIVNK